MEWSESRLMYVIGIHWNLNFAKIFFTVCGFLMGGFLLSNHVDTFSYDVTQLEIGNF